MPSILVADDDRTIQEMLAELLEEQGYEVGTCGDGTQLLPALQSRPYDLLVLDVLLPHVNGFVLVEQIRSTPGLAELPVVMTSGIYRSRNHCADMVSRYRILDYLDKPLATDRLLRLVHDAVGPGASSADAELEGHGLADGDAVLAAPVTRGEPEPVTLGTPKRGAQTGRPPPPPRPSGARAAFESRVHEAETAVAADWPSRRDARRARAARPEAAAIDPAVARLVAAAASAEQRQVETAARSFGTSAFIMQGSIGKTPVAAILGKLWQQRASGGLLLRRGKIKKIVYLRDGNPYQLKSNLVSECLGQILLRERLITSGECERSLELMKETGQRQGEILVQMRSLTSNNLAFALELQVETKLFETFTWESGEYRFNASIDLPADELEVEWSGPEIVAEGIRRTFDETRLRQWMLPVLDVPLAFRAPPLDLELLRLRQEEQQAVASIAPPITTRELIDSLPLPPPDTLRLVYTLVALEILLPAR